MYNFVLIKRSSKFLKKLLTYFRGTTISNFQILCALVKLGSVLAGTFSELGVVNYFLTNPD